MMHSGKATQAALKLIFIALFIIIGVCVVGILAKYVSAFIAACAYSLFGIWVLFSAFCFYFFRDPTPAVPSDVKSIVSPAHGKVDLVDETIEPDFMGGKCKRISIFLSVLDVHVQNAPVRSRITFERYTTGQFLNAMRADSGTQNENLLLGLESSEEPGERIGVRLIAGLIARRIVPFVHQGDSVDRGDRISLIQFGSRCDLYLPLSTQVLAKVGDRVKGGETILAKRA